MVRVPGTAVTPSGETTASYIAIEPFRVDKVDTDFDILRQSAERPSSRHKEPSISAGRIRPGFRDETPNLTTQSTVLPIERHLSEQCSGEFMIGGALPLQIERPRQEREFERLPARSRRFDPRRRRTARVLGEAPEGERRLQPFGMPGIETRLRHQRRADRWRIGVGEEEMMLNADGRRQDQMIPIQRRTTGLPPAPAIRLEPDQALRGDAVRRRCQSHMSGEGIGAPEHEDIQAGPVRICEDIEAPNADLCQAPVRPAGLEARVRTRPNPLDTRRSVASARRRAFPATGSPYIDKRRRAALASMGAWSLSVRGEVGLSPSFPL